MALRRFGCKPLWQYGAAFAIAFASGIILASLTTDESGVVLVATAGLALLSGSIYAPRWALMVGLLAVALPYAWSPTAGGGIVPPAAAVGAIWAIGGVIRVGARSPKELAAVVHPSLLDIAVLTFLVLPLFSAAVQGESISLFLYFAANAGAPYVGLRILVAGDAELCRVTIRALLTIGLGVAIAAVAEAIFGFNVSDIFSNPDLQQWNRVYERGGWPRVDASLGHPIALGAFLLFPLALWVTQADRRWVLTVPVILVSIGLSFSRGPWIGAAILMALLILALTSGRRRLLAIGLMVVIGAVFLLAVPTARELLLDSLGGDSVAGNNAELRADVIRSSFEQLSVLGDPLPQSQTGLLLPGNADIASFLALTVLRTGIVGLLAWTAIGILLGASMTEAMRRHDRDYLIVGAIMSVQFVLLIAMSMITNYQHFFWLGIALLASLQVAARRGPAKSYLSAR